MKKPTKKPEPKCSHSKDDMVKFIDIKKNPFWYCKKCGIFVREK